MNKTSREEKLQKKREWYHRNLEKAKAQAKKSREKHKERRALDNKKWVIANKENSQKYHKEYHKKWYQENKESRDVQNMQWAKQNPERMKQIQKESRLKNIESFKEYSSKYILTQSGRFRSLRGSATARNYSVQITYAQFCEIITMPCIYCGENEKRIGIDRVDNTKGYTIENSAPCCTPCNMMKKAMLVEQFTAHIKKIYNHQFSN